MEEQILYDVNSEQAVLGAFILNSDYYYKITSCLEEEHFFEPVHKEIFSLLKKSFENDGIKDLHAISQEITNIGIKYNLDNYISVLLNMGSSIVNIEGYCKSIKNFFIKRKLRALSDSIQKSIEENSDIEKICQETEDKLNVLTQEASEKKYNFESANEICAKRVLQIEDIVKNDAEPQNIIKTELFDYDRYFGGLIRKNLTILAARANCGKALPLDTKILTTDGWKENKNIKVGDKLIDPFGKEVSVIGVFPQTGKRKCYKIFFEDRDIVADENHLWEVFYSGWDNAEILTTEQLLRLNNKPKYKGFLSIRMFNSKYCKSFTKSRILFGSKKLREKILNNFIVNNFSKTTWKSKALFMRQLAFSLGYKCFINFSNNAYSLNIIDDKSKKLYIKDIQPAKKQRTQCIAVDSPEHLYVAEDFITTHNTTFALQIALNIAKNKNVLFFSQEMCNSEQGDKILSNFAHINSMNIRDSRITIEEIEKIKNVMQNNGSLNLYISDAYGVTSNYIRKTLQKFEKTVGKIDLVIVDHLQIMADNKPNSNRVSELSNISMDCKNIAKEFDCAFLLLSQLSRKTEERDDPRPQLADLRESGAIEQNADTVMFLFRQAYYTERKLNGLSIDNPNFDNLKKQFEMQKNQADLTVQKNRSGKLGSIKLYFNPEYSQFSDMTGHLLEESYQHSC